VIGVGSETGQSPKLIYFKNIKFYNAYQEGTKINNEVNERPLKNIGMHWSIRHRLFQRVPSPSPCTPLVGSQAGGAKGGRGDHRPDPVPFPADDGTPTPPADDQHSRQWHAQNSRGGYGGA